MGGSVNTFRLDLQLHSMTVDLGIFLYCPDLLSQSEDCSLALKLWGSGGYRGNYTVWRETEKGLGPSAPPPGYGRAQCLTP